MSFSTLALLATAFASGSAAPAEAPIAAAKPFIFKFSFSNMVASLPIMLKGMLGIFAVTAVILFTIYILSKLFKSKPEETE